MTIGTLPGAPSTRRAPQREVPRPVRTLVPAVAGLGAAGGLTMVAAAPLTGSPVLQLLFLLGGLASIGAAGFLACALFAGLRPFPWMFALVLAGAGVLLLVDVLLATTDLFRPRAAPGLPDAARVAAGVVAVLGVSSAAGATWRRRTVRLLLAAGGLTWALWVAGLLA